ncbi:hypothetical protein [Micrococcus luteus]|uniref:hypothetical protein n=1 Tax=Micrococcus luteus TaxID=1270 RepID=UPI0036762E7B
MRVRTSAFAASAALALLLTGCGGATSSESAAPKESSQASSSADPAAASEANEAASESADSAEASAQSEAADEGGLKLGDTHTWSDGLAITVSEGEEYTPSEYAVGAEEEGTPMRFTVTLKNGTDEPVEAMMLSLQASSGSQTNEAIYDSQQGIEPPTVAVQPGKELTWDVAFMVIDPSDLVLDVSTMHDFTAEKVYFKAS